MQKILFIDVEKCTGCGICEIVCSLHNEKECGLSRSRIRIIRWREAGLNIPIVCQQCNEPICEKVCPTKAIYKDGKTGVVLINHDICIGCRMCVQACPFGALTFDVEKGKVIKCDLCNGEPKCAEFCPVGAIKYTTVTKAILERRASSVIRFGELIKKLVEQEILRI